jgi:hypothetical protein
LLAVRDGLGVNGVTVVIIEDEDVVVASGGRDNEAASLIGAYLASDGLTVGVDVVGALDLRCIIVGLQVGRGVGWSTKDIGISR